MRCTCGRTSRQTRARPPRCCRWGGRRRPQEPAPSSARGWAARAAPPRARGWGGRRVRCCAVGVGALPCRQRATSRAPQFDSRPRPSQSRPPAALSGGSPGWWRLLALHALYARWCGGRAQGRRQVLRPCGRHPPAGCIVVGPSLVWCSTVCRGACDAPPWAAVPRGPLLPGRCCRPIAGLRV